MSVCHSDSTISLILWLSVRFHSALVGGLFNSQKKKKKKKKNEVLSRIMLTNKVRRFLCSTAPIGKTPRSAKQAELEVLSGKPWMLICMHENVIDHLYHGSAHASCDKARA